MNLAERYNAEQDARSRAVREFVGEDVLFSLKGSRHGAGVLTIMEEGNRYGERAAINLDGTHTRLPNRRPEFMGKDKRRGY